MSNKNLETFMKVADLGSFSKAAEELFISSTAVIKQINSPEEELELILFTRSHNGTILTKAGESIYQDSKYVKESIIREKHAENTNENIVYKWTQVFIIKNN